MKLKMSLIIGCCALSTLSGCDFLEFDESQGVNKEQVFSYFDNVSRLAIAVYRELPADWGEIGGALRESATDNAVYTWGDNSVYDIYNNKWSPLNVIDSNWKSLYSTIRDANSFLENYSEDKLERFRWDKDYAQNIEKANMYVHEVRLLRAFYYFELAKRYGDVPLLTRTYRTDEINEVDKQSFAEIIRFVVRECDELIPLLPISHQDFYKETGRVTRSFGMALKARALLYAASPLHNPKQDKALWKEAAKASHDLIMTNWFSLPKLTVDPLYASTGGNDVLKSSQLIFERRGSDSNDFEQRNLPIGFEKGNSGNTPTQDLVDAYEMKDGTIFDWSNPDHVKTIYFDAQGKPTRDPRLYLNVLCNGSMFMGKKIETFVGGSNGSPIDGATLTGYYLRKLMNETVSLTPTRIIKKTHHYPIFRYAEVLLNYAEAMTEWKDADYKDADFTLSAREALNLIREAAGMPLVTATNDQFMIRLKNERRIELAFEDHRFWDIRRWKIGEVVKQIHGVKLTNVSGVVTAERTLVQTRVWDDKMYLYPIPRQEYYKNHKLGQNKGW